MSARPIHLADLLEIMADTIPDRPAVVTLDHSWTFAELDERATRLANHLRAAGLEPGEHVAIHSPNRIEWIEAFYGVLKARGVPINVNYKYLVDELRHIYTNSDSVMAIVAPHYESLAREASEDQLREVLVMGEPYESALAAASADRQVEGRSGDDHYIIYTGGTTGSPKGVVWRNEDIIRAAMNAARYGAPLESLEQLAAEARANENPMTLLAAGPMMHGGSQWIMGNGHVSGQTVALYVEETFEPTSVLDLVEKRGVVSLTVLGDAMARPIAEAIAAEPDRWDLSGLMAISTGAAPLTGSVREELLAVLPGRFILDTYGASESGAAGSTLDDGTGDGQARFGVGPDVEVFTADWEPAPVGVDGLLARSGAMPLGYYKDDAKTAATFRVIDGVRWVVPGDFARREDDGTVVVLGRGSVCINTGGEKVHPEEVEAAMRRHPAVFDVAVVGTPHPRWGQQVTAVVQLREGHAATQDELVDHVHGLLANYKAPKDVHFVDRVPRTPVSKVDYPAVTALASSLSSV
jgi:acyl-CoA synthetase (AMP-forming)/AMP-acid ligase II